MKYKIWNKTDNMFTPSGEMFTAEQILRKYPLAKVEKFIVCDAPINMGVFMEFEQTKAMYSKMILDTKAAHPDWAGQSITDSMTEQEVLNAISFWEEHPPLPLPSSEERIAAAMEFQNIMSV